MNEYLKFFLCAIGLMILAGTIVKKMVPRDSALPIVEAKPGIIYSVKSSSAAIVNTGYLVKSDYTVYRISDHTEKPVVQVPVKPQTGKRGKPVKPQAVNPVKTPEPEKKEEDVFNLYTIENIVKGSDKSYSLNKTKELKGVTVDLLTVTPYNGNRILKFRVTNNTDKFFIPQAIGIAETKSDLYFRQVINARETVMGYLMFPAKSAGLTFSLTESGGGYRKFSIVID